MYDNPCLLLSRSSCQRERSDDRLTNISKTDKSISVIAGLWYPFPNIKGRFGTEDSTPLLGNHRERIVREKKKTVSGSKVITDIHFQAIVVCSC